MDSEEVLKRALAREKQARIQAETIAETVTRRLHSLNLELDQKVKEATADVQAREAELRASHSEVVEALRLRDSFLASMTHELRSPLHSILGLSEALLEGAYGDPNERQARSLKTIHDSGQHLLSLIDNVLEVSKLAAGKADLDLEFVNCRQVCSEAFTHVSALASGKGVSCEVESIDENLRVYANNLRVRQMLINLLSNAIKFTPKGGRVSLGCRVEDSRDSVCFVVADSGIGISREDFPKLFQPFVQLSDGLKRQAGGTGLGLMLVQRMADIYGGSVAVQSEVGEGTSFTVTLPSGPAGEEPDEAGELAGTALIIEDSEVQRLFLRRRLMRLDYKVFEAADGLVGLEVLREKKPDIVLLDLVMPKLDGKDVLKLLRAEEQFVDTPVAIVSAADTPGNRAECLKMGAQAYFVKPIRAEELEAFVSKFNRSASTDEPYR